MNLDHTNVKLDQGTGQILVDEFSNTDQKGIYAIGDVIKGGVSLTPVAVRAGRILAERVFNQRSNLKMNYQNIATVIFSHPPTGTLGLSAEAAIEKFGADSVKVYKSEFVNMLYGLVPADGSVHRPKSLFKLVTHLEGDGVERVVGVHGIGQGIDEIMQTASVALNMGTTKQDFDNTVAIHPTASEEFVLMDNKFI